MAPVSEAPAGASDHAGIRRTLYLTGNPGDPAVNITLTCWGWIIPTDYLCASLMSTIQKHKILHVYDYRRSTVLQPRQNDVV